MGSLHQKEGRQRACEEQSREYHQRSRVLAGSDPEPAIRSTERDVVQSLLEDDFEEVRGCQVVMQHSLVGESAANGAIETVSQQSREVGRGPGSKNESRASCRRSSRSASQKPEGDIECGLNPLRRQTST